MNQILHRLIYMELIQAAATIGLLTLLVYFVMVNILESKAVPSTGSVHDADPAPSGVGSDILITNKLDVEANRDIPIAGINTETSKIPMTTIGGPAQPGGENVTQLSVFNEQAKGVLPVNHDLFEKPADFGSDVTNVNQFYRNNPDIFDRSVAHVPDAVAWHTQSQELFNKLSNEAPHQVIKASNFEKEPLA